MENNMKDFIDYLYYIGFLCPDNLTKLITIYESQNNMGNNCDKVIDNKMENKYNKMALSMNQLIKQSSPEEVQEMMNRIVNNYLKNRNKIIVSMARKLYKFYRNKELKFYFVFWRKMAKFLKHQQMEMLKLNLNSINNGYFINNDNKTINSLNTPHPSQNYYSTTSKLNTSNNKFNRAKSRGNTSKNTDIEDLIITNNHLDRRTQDFIKRQEKFIQLKSFNKMQIKEKKEQEERLVCTFNPKLNKSSQKTRKICNNSQYYNVNNRNANILNNNMYNKSLNLNNSANAYYINVNYGNNNYINNNYDYNYSIINNNSTSFNNNNSILRLYNDAQRYKERKKVLKKSIDDERGLTFKPKVFTCKNKYQTSKNFEERNKKLLENKQNLSMIQEYIVQRQVKEENDKGKENELIHEYMKNLKEMNKEL